MNQNIQELLSQKIKPKTSPLGMEKHVQTTCKTRTLTSSVCQEVHWYQDLTRASPFSLLIAKTLHVVMQ